MHTTLEYIRMMNHRRSNAHFSYRGFECHPTEKPFFSLTPNSGVDCVARLASNALNLNKNDAKHMTRIIRHSFLYFFSFMQTALPL